MFITRHDTSEDGETVVGSAARVVVPDTESIRSAGNTEDAGRAGRSQLVSLALPDRAGLLLRRAPGPATPEHAGRLVERRSRAVVGDAWADLHFVELARGELVRVALSMARLAHVRTVVVCPAGVSPGRTALALAVAGMLQQRRASQAPVVTCAVCPPLGDGRTAIPHEVRVAAAGQVQERLVWEIVTWDDLKSTTLVN
ncbi:MULTISPECIES: hypothetical protein [Pseudofrankia]|uniref:hypothetical protein n=1 Tax=Pseudofrankia TaxID=2994363 RepID=UPI000234C484|nr:MULTISPECIES: hypothetical protein [Pseudofrankia]